MRRYLYKYYITHENLLINNSVIETQRKSSLYLHGVGQEVAS